MAEQLLEIQTLCRERPPLVDWPPVNLSPTPAALSEQIVGGVLAPRAAPAQTCSQTGGAAVLLPQGAVQNYRVGAGAPEIRHRVYFRSSAPFITAN